MDIKKSNTIYCSSHDIDYVNPDIDYINKLLIVLGITIKGYAEKSR